MKNKMSVVIAALFLMVFLGSIWVYWYKAQQAKDKIIAGDVALLAQILNTIDRECGILSFEHTKNNIDFLNVISFEGSEVGPINLKHPENWQGAYLKDNPTIQEKYYQVINTDHGYWVAPGDGVKLSNGLQIGKDIVFNKDTNMQKLVDTLLHYNGQALAVQILNGETQELEGVNRYNETIARDRLRNM